MPGPQAFARITKVDEATRTVTGRACQEYPDLTGEILDYDTSKPYFKNWVKETRKASNGKSLGNIRAMHGNVAAGKMTGIEFNDTEKAMDISTKVVDDNEWEKVLEGVYTGFSIGGKYVGKKWSDPKDPELKRYTADPIEISLVDAPCIPTALFFDVTKADGSQIQKAFKALEKKDEGKQAEGEKKGSEGEQKLEDKDPGDAVGGAAKAKGPGDDEDDDEDDLFDVEGTPEELKQFAAVVKGANISLGKVNQIIEAARSAGLSVLLHEIFVEKNFADPDNRHFPINTPDQIKAAWFFINQPATAEKYEGKALDAIKQRIMDAWKADETMDEEVPDIATISKRAKGSQLEKLHELSLCKSFYTCADACNALSTLKYLVSSAEYEYAMSGNSGLAAKLKLQVASLAQVIAEMVQAEADAMGEDGMTLSVTSEVTKKLTDDLIKACDLTDDLKKMGARNSKQDLLRIQNVHNAAQELGAMCSKKNSSGYYDDEEDGDADGDGGDNNADDSKGDSKKVVKAAKGTPDLAKVVAEAVEKATKPLVDRIQHLEAQPKQTTVRLRAVGKGEDVAPVEAEKNTHVNPVLKGSGEVDEAATSIKELHKAGGVPILFTK